MKLAASNIGWAAEMDARVLRHMADAGYSGLEIAPTRLFPEKPYDAPERIAAFSREIRREYGLSVCSMQSIWYGMGEKIVESGENRAILLAYTDKAIRFAEAAGCDNLVFGCPRNRAIRGEADVPVVEDFLWRCAEAAARHGVVIALEANPPIYHTNYINTTAQALALLKRLNHPSLKLNLDFGTVVENGEALDWIDRDGGFIHHVHISEPGLTPIRCRPEHLELKRRLGQIGYEGYVSIEMGSREDAVLQAIDYVKGSF